MLLPRRYWDIQRIAATAVLGLFAVIIGFSLLASAPDLAPQKKTAQPAVEAFDIRLDKAPTEQSIVPEAPINPQINKKLQPLFEVTVQDKTIEQATQQVVLSRKAERSGDLRQAIEFQRRAAALKPANMVYQIDLAILYDRAGDGANALRLYRRILDVDSTTLPASLNVAELRDRAAYLAAKE